MTTKRKASIERKTNETEIELTLDLNGDGSRRNINTSVPFFDHMLVHIAAHGHLDLDIRAKGDIEIDFHHIVEDLGITLAKALKEALGDFAGINRYGHFTLPMDETLVSIALDFSGRPHLTYNVKNLPQKIGNFDTELSREFFQALANNIPMSIHINLLYGENGHHILEAIFKCFGRALSMAVSLNPRIKKDAIPSSKGVI
jgi:imidazoleglycerol-phosphate dehydratase